MNPFELWCEYRRLSVRLTIHGDRLRHKGPEGAVKAVLPLLVKNKVTMVACIVDSSRYPVTGGPFIPWCAPMSPDRAAALLGGLEATVSKVTGIEGWPADCLVRLLGLIARQPVSTLADDLTYFRGRFNTIVMLSEMPPLRSAQQGEYESHSILSSARLLSRQGTHRGAIESDELDRPRQSFRSVLGKKALPLEGLKDLAVTLFLTCFATIAKCEKTLANRQIPTVGLELHAQGLSWSIEAGNVLAFINFLAALPVWFEQTRQAGAVTVKSDGGKNAVATKRKKLQSVGEYALKLVNEGNYRSRRSTTIGIKDRISGFQLMTISRALMPDQTQRAVKGWLKELGCAPDARGEKKSGPKLE